MYSYAAHPSHKEKANRPTPKHCGHYEVLYTQAVPQLSQSQVGNTRTEKCGGAKRAKSWSRWWLVYLNLLQPLMMQVLQGRKGRMPCASTHSDSYMHLVHTYMYIDALAMSQSVA